MALTSKVIMDVRGSGSNDNGGGFDPTYGTVDYSQQASPQLSLTDVECTGAVPDITSVAGGFTSDMLGNLCQIVSGGSFNTGFYTIVSVTDSNSVTLDRNPCVGPTSGGTLNVGGALRSPALAAGVIQGGGIIYWKDDADHTASDSSYNTVDGFIRLYSNTALIGYGSTRSDRTTYPTYTLSTTPPDSVTLYCANHTYIENIEADGSGVANQYGIYNGNDTMTVCYRVRSHHFYVPFGNVRTLRCKAWACTNTGFYNCLSYYSLYHATEGAFRLAFGGDGFTLASHCIAKGAQTGFQVYNGSATLQNCVAYKCTNGYALANVSIPPVINCIAALCTTRGFSFAGDSFQPMLVNCAAYNNADDFDSRYSLYRKVNCITLTPDVGDTNGTNLFTDPTSNDFSLTDTAAYGEALRALGLSTIGPDSDTVGFGDIGAAQHEDTGGGGISVQPVRTF